MFHLLRYFSLISSIGILAVVLALTLFYRHLAFAELIAHEERSNVALTTALSNSLRGRLSHFIDTSVSGPAEGDKSEADVERLRLHIVGLMSGLSIVKVKVFNSAGVTLFSTQLSQIGESRANNQGFQRAVKGGVASAIAFKHQVDTFDGVIADRSLVSSYVPMYGSDRKGIVGVIEVYSDVTELVEVLENTLFKIVLGVAGCLLGLYLFLYLVVLRADKILKRSSAEIRYLAYHDALTGLPNRRCFTEHLEELLADEPDGLAVIFVDLDGFKRVNDRFGHDAGDSLLRTQAQRLKACFESEALVARFGGDEFAAIVPASLKEGAESVSLTELVLQSLSEPVQFEGVSYEVGCSIGVSYFPRSGVTVDDLLRNADHAMYRMKQLELKRAHLSSCSETV